jgi:Kef-type K+ transport system membrane component KefB
MAGPENRRPLPGLLRLIAALLLQGATAGASTSNPGAAGETLFLYEVLELAAVIVLAKLGAEAFERMRQPGVLGELAVGMALSALALAGFAAIESWRSSEVLHIAAEIGLMLLLFEVGLESHLSELLEVGWSALLAAVLGVAAPMVLGYGVTALFFPNEPWYTALFVGGALTATSVGITARVLRDLRKLDTKEARIILGAAVVDDVLGLIVLAVISGLVSSLARGAGGEVSAAMVVGIVLKAALFLLGAIFVGRFVHFNAVRFGARFRVSGVPLVIALSFCFTLSAVAGLIGLAPIVGAFAAGLVLEPGDYQVYQQKGEQPIELLIRPLTTFLTPVFFVLMGLKADLRAFASSNVLVFALVVIVAAILGKQACSLGVLERGVRRAVVGVGMIPRGEVGLIFTSIGAGLSVAGRPVFSADLVSAMIAMVIATTLVTPPLLKRLLGAGEAETA